MPGLRQWAAPGRQLRLRQRWRFRGPSPRPIALVVLAALAAEPSVITGGLEARDTQLMRDALRTLGVGHRRGQRRSAGGASGRSLPPGGFVADGTIVIAASAGTVMRFVPPIAALARWHGAVRRRPAGVHAVRWLRCWCAQHIGARSTAAGTQLPFAAHWQSQAARRRRHRGRGGSSQFLGGLLLPAPDTPTASTSDTLAARSPHSPRPDDPGNVARPRHRRLTTPQRTAGSSLPARSEVLTHRSSPTFQCRTVSGTAAALTGGTVTCRKLAKRNHPAREMRSAGSCSTSARRSALEGNLTARSGNRSHPRR